MTDETHVHTTPDDPHVHPTADDPPTATPPPEASDTDNVLVAHHVTKRFGGLIAVNTIDMNIRRGMIYSLIGPNGAGKTTFFNVIAGILPPSSGNVTVNGVPLIAPSRRAWMEPIIWFLPFFAILIFGVSVSGPNVQLQAIWTLLALLVVTLILPTALARPAWYERFIRSLGIFRNARPNDVV